MGRWFSQAAAITLVNLRTLKERKGAALAAAFGIAGVVAVFVAVLSIGVGFRRTLVSSGSPDTAMVMRAGSDSEMVSGLLHQDTRVIADTPGILRTAQGPAASAELFVVVDVPKRSTGTAANVPLRGVQPAAFVVRDKVKIVAGRRFEPGKNEIIVGKAALEQFAGLDLGSTLRWGENTWTVVGIFTADGAVSESELWCDASVLQPAYRRGDTFQSVYAKLTSAAAFTAFKDTLTTDPRLDVKVVREDEYFASQSQALSAIINFLGTLIAGLMAVGATFGALNTMYTAVASRTREIATLRALGFGAGPVVVSILVESLALALAGGVVGAAAAYFAFNGYKASTINFQSFSQVAFAFAVTPPLLIGGIAIALLMGLIGGLFPAIRAARMPVVTALREL
ncbi:MAG: putative transport system permease protein [Acidobacteriota bacterium]|nr:putative transport system permease protein [Acidobacteriota bacterium]